LNADSVEAALGLGLVAFAEGKNKEALKRFEELDHRNDLSETLQFVVAYYAAKAAGNIRDVAKPYWEKAKSMDHLKEEFSSRFEEIERALRIYE